MPGYLQKLNGMSSAELETEFDKVIPDTLNEITDSQVFCDTMAGTNAVMWSVDDNEFDIPNLVIGNDDAHLPMTYHASGDQLEDKGHCGDEITGEAQVVFDDDGNFTYEEISADVVGF